MFPNVSNIISFGYISERTKIIIFSHQQQTTKLVKLKLCGTTISAAYNLSSPSALDFIH